MTRESALWSWLRNGSRQYVVTGELHLCRVESSAGEGFPDVEGCWSGKAFTIELKVAERPKRETTKIDFKHLRPAQVLWLTQRRRAGGRAWLLLQVGSSHEAKRYLLDGLKAAQVLEGLTEIELNAYSVAVSDGAPTHFLHKAATWNAFL